ncbi:MAG: AgmX/PglI C-terminal domain-containing protein [Anaeromyxobacteraceae bacterium]
MKFSCDRCGKKYATAETPAPGRVYKLKCKACGHLIVVKTPSDGPAVSPSPPRPPAVVERSPQGAAPALTPFEFASAPQSPPSASAGEATSEITEYATAEEPTPPPGEGGYVDIFADSAPPPAPAEDDPFLKAARGSLPDNYTGGTGLNVPFADRRAEGDAAAHEPPPVHELPPPSAFAPPPSPASEDKKKSGLPVVLIGFGLAVVVGIVVLVALTSGKKAPPTARPPAPIAAPAIQPPAPPPSAPVTETAKVEAKKAEPVPRREEKKREEKKVAKAEPKPLPPPPPPPKPEPKAVAKAAPEKPVDLPDAASALSPAAVQKVVNASRRAFEACIDQAAKRGTDTKFDGRKVALRLNVNPNGFVTYPTLDDVTLNRTDLGECLKAAARLMVFPKFQGDVFHVEVPLTLRGG